MSYYKLIRFGSVDLPDCDPETPFDTGDAELNTFAMAGGGVFVAQKTDRANIHGPVLMARGTYVATSATVLAANLDSLRAQHGMRQKLYRQMQDDSVQWTEAWLLEASGNIGPNNVDNQDLSLSFLQQDRAWYGSAAKTITSTLAGATKGVSICNAGTLENLNNVLTIVAGGSSITVLRITQGSTTNLFTTAAITAAHTVVIDQGNWTVEKESVDWFTHLHRGIGHAIGNWITIPTTTATLLFTCTSGSTGHAISIAYRDTFR